MKCYYNQNSKDSIASVLERHCESEAKKHSTKYKKNVTLNISKSTNRSEQLKILKKLMPEAKSILCAGCRDDSEVQSFIKAGYKAHGIDVHSETDLISQSSMEEMTSTISEKSYDIVYSRHSLEHVAFPLVALESIRKVSRLGCFIILPFSPAIASRKHPTIFDVMTIDSSRLAKQDYERWLELLKEDFSVVEPYKLIHYKVSGDELELFFRWA